MPGAFDRVSRHLLVHASPTKRATASIDLLDQLGAAYGTAERARPLVAVLDNAAIHRAASQQPAPAPSANGSPSNGCRNMPPN